jgi:DNA repair exonuclease SbcCD ATPase subunit
MIDEKINKTLKELEQGLKDVESARKQVERTVSSFSNLNTTTLDYVNKLGTITTKVQELVDNVGKDYAQKVKDFEKDREVVIKSSNTATEKLSNATEVFKDSLVEIQTKLKYSLIVGNYILVGNSSYL